MKYKKIGDFIICELPNIKEIDMEQVELIVEHTHNTWQANRPKEEIRENTIQGKKAELVIEKILTENSKARFISYDTIRADKFEKHAPFDGLIYQADMDDSSIKEAVNRINNDVAQSVGDSGLIAENTRKYLEDQGIYTIEIKSSLLQVSRDYKSMFHKSPKERTNEDYEALCTHIREFYDYFTYPHYCRDDSSINRFYEYVKYVQKLRKLNTSTNRQTFLYELMKIEFDNSCNIYTRVFFDVISDELIVPGYVLKGRFFEEPRIRKMPSQKSKNAIYYMYHMRYGVSFAEIDKDEELWGWDRMEAYTKLFGAMNPKCPVCNKPLRLVETTRAEDISNHKFLYVCDACPQDTKWNELSNIHSKNMR